MLRISRGVRRGLCQTRVCSSETKPKTNDDDTPSDIVTEETQAGPGGTWWRVTVKEAPRYMWSSYSERPHPRGIDIDYEAEQKARTPQFTEYFDEIPDDINPTKVQPFLEYRNVALGSYHGVNEDLDELYWRPVRNHRNWNLEKLKEQDDIQWNEYKQRNGFFADEYIKSDEYTRRYGGKHDDYEAYCWSYKNYFRRYAGQRPLWKTKFSCWYHDANELHQVTHSARYYRSYGTPAEEQDNSAYRFDAELQGTYATNHPCPLCRDWKLLVNYRNVPLLEQFLDSQTGQQYPLYKTNICQFAHARISQAIDASRQLGYLATPHVEMKHTEWNMEAYEPTPQTPF